jgi:TonB family protein
MRKKCDSIREWLGAFADGELEPDKAEQVISHLETCADCRRELDQIQELSRLAKSVEHPRLADDYWDWHRTRVWRGIRERKRVPEPRYRPVFMWPKLAAAAAGFVIVLVVVLAGWRTLLMRPGRTRYVNPVGALPAELESASQPVASAPAGRAGEGAEGQTPTAAESRSDQLARVQATAEPGAVGNEVGHAAKGAGTITGTMAAVRPSTAPSRQAGQRLEVAAGDRGKGLASAPQAERSLRFAAEKKNGTVSGPVLTESPSLAAPDVTDTGTVLLSVNTDSTGRVVNVAIRRSSGSARLDSLALRQMRMSRFRAAVKNNRRVASSFEYRFRLPKKQARPVERDRPTVDRANPDRQQYQRKSEQPDTKSDRHEVKQPDKRSDKQEVKPPDKQSDKQEVKRPDKQSEKQEVKPPDKQSDKQDADRSDKQEIKRPDGQSDKQGDNQSGSQQDSQPTGPVKKVRR